MIVTMIISLYTSRVILQTLGINDYGTYQAVGGIVGVLSFVQTALSTGTSRFITFGIGEKNIEKLKRVFSTTLSAHIILASLVILLAESIGLWFLYNKMNIQIERQDAAVIVYHISVITVFFSLTQVPYHACIIAHERMNVYAYISILDAVLKLIIAVAISYTSFDRLIVYALLLCFVNLGIMLYYRLYCLRKFEESHYHLEFDKSLFKEITSFSGWSLLSGTSIALNNQGILIVLNMFFTPAIVTARAISLQVNMAANQLMSNFQTAANPQIVKMYAAKDYEGSKKLLLQTTRFSYYLMLMMCLPICLTAEPLLRLWLGNVPDYSVQFLQLIIIQSLFQVFNTSFYRALYTKGQLRENALLSPILLIVSFPVVYFLFVAGCSPVALSWVSLIAYALLGLVIKPILIIKIADYNLNDIRSVFRPCFIVTFVSIIIPVMVYIHISNRLDNPIYLLFIILISFISVALTVWCLGLNGYVKKEIITNIKSKLK